MAAETMAREHAMAMVSLKDSAEMEKEKEMNRVERETKHIVETEWAEKV